MDHHQRAELILQEHYDRVASINAEGWKTANLRKRRHVKRMMAQALVALAVRLDRTLMRPTVGLERVTPSTR